MSSVVQEHVGVIILAVFIVIAVFGPVGCLIFTRRREHRKYHPSPKAFRKARSKLGTVADCRRDTEKGLSGDPEWTDNCPICIGPLCPVAQDEAGPEAGPEAMVEIKGALSGPRDAGGAGGAGGSGAAVGGGSEARNSTASDVAVPGATEARNSAASDAAEGECTEARNTIESTAEEGGRTEARNSTASSTAEVDGTKARGSTASKASVNPTAPDLNDPETQASRTARLRLSMRRHRVSTERSVEILKLRSCGHWFHARCLSSWFLIDRYDCPVCRKSYWDGKPRRTGPMDTFLRSEYSPTPTAARMGIGTVV